MTVAKAKRICRMLIQVEYELTLRKNCKGEVKAYQSVICPKSALTRLRSVRKALSQNDMGDL